MVKLPALLAAALAATASAAPAVVWKGASGRSSAAPSHISEAIDARSLLASSVTEGDNDSSALSAVVFLVGRTDDGSEGLAALASSGKLPGVREQYGRADEIHHAVGGVESSRTVARDARQGSAVAEVSLDEFQRKLSSMAQTEVEGGDAEGKKVSRSEQKRRRAISEADVLVVTISPSEDASKIDSAIVAAIESSAVTNVILSSIRSTDEVKRARVLAVKERFSRSKMAAASPRASAARRLEDEANNENGQNNNNNQNQDEEGVYYVNMTPNIFAGLLFFFMFVFVAHLGLMCMNAIEGQDVYVKKMPHIGREV
ncbi:hypothetical protein ACHAXT_006580 [Thalassiosira profunda]